MSANAIFSTHRLFNKTALITGASGGIGAATAILFARAGANVIISARRKDQLAKVAEEARKANKEGQTGQGGKVFELVLDVSDRRSADGMWLSCCLSGCMANGCPQTSSTGFLQTLKRLTSSSTMPALSTEQTTLATCTLRVPLVEFS